MKIFNTILLASVMLLSAATSQAQLNTFESGTPASASEMNANFAAVAAAIEELEGRVAELEDAAGNRSVMNRTYRVYAYHNMIEQQVDPENATFLDVVSAGTFVISFDADSATYATVTGVHQEREVGVGWFLAEAGTEFEHQAPSAPFMSGSITENLTGENGLLLPYSQSEVGVINIEGINALFSVSPGGDVLIGGTRSSLTDSFEAGFYIGVEIFPVDQ